MQWVEMQKLRTLEKFQIIDVRSKAEQEVANKMLRRI